jgi:hypothetical protein
VAELVQRIIRDAESIILVRLGNLITGAAIAA